MVQLELHLTKVQFNKFNKGLGFQMTSAQIANTHGGDHKVNLEVDKKLFNRIQRNYKKGKAVRFPKNLNAYQVVFPFEDVDNIEGGDIKGAFKRFGRKMKKAFKPALPVLKKVGQAALPVLKTVGKEVIKTGLPILTSAAGTAAGAYLGGPAGAMIGDKLGESAGSAAASSINKQIGSGMGKGSQAMKEKMARLRAMRRGSAVTGEGLVDRIHRKVKIPVASAVSSRVPKVKNPRMKIPNSLLLNGINQVHGGSFSGFQYA